ASVPIPCSLFPVPCSLLPAPCLLPLSLYPQTARPDILLIQRRRKHLQRLRHAPEAPLPCRKRIVQNIGMKSLHRASDQITLNAVLNERNASSKYCSPQKHKFVFTNFSG